MENEPAPRAGSDSCLFLRPDALLAAGFFVDTAAEDKQPLDEVFHLENQLARLATPAAGMMGEAR